MRKGALFNDLFAEAGENGYFSRALAQNLTNAAEFDAQGR